MLYHTNVRPKDLHGEVLQPLDLVIIGEIPDHYLSDADGEEAAILNSYAGRYGLITYYMNEPFFYDKKDHSGWVNPDGTVVYVRSHTVAGDHISSYGFWLSSKSLQKIPYNPIIMNVFADFPWEMTEDSGPGTKHFIRKGMPWFDRLKDIMETPYSELVLAGDAAMRLLRIK